MESVVMGREPRMEFGGAICHVMNRGNHLDAIFKDGNDREMFLRTLEEGCEASGWVAHGFVLMRNHCQLKPQFTDTKTLGRSLRIFWRMDMTFVPFRNCSAIKTSPPR